MINIRTKITEIRIKINSMKIDNLVPALITTIIFITIIFYNNFSYEKIRTIAWLFGFTGASIFIVFMMFAIGFEVTKSLVHISAGLSLIIFLAQSYCAAPNHSVNSDNALRLLLLISFIYLLVDFLKKLHKGLSLYGYTDIFKRLKNEYITKSILSVIFLTILFYFLWTIYVVMSPIILDLCIYKSI